MHKIFSFKGVVRNTDNMLADEGECIEVMNMRIKDGSLVPVGRPVDVAALGYAYSRILWHEAAGCYLCLTDEQNPALHIYDKEWTLQKDSEGNLLESYDTGCPMRGSPFGICPIDMRYSENELRFFGTGGKGGTNLEAVFDMETKEFKVINK